MAHVVRSGKFQGTLGAVRSGAVIYSSKSKHNTCTMAMGKKAASIYDPFYG